MGEPEPIGDIGVERQGGTVVIMLEHNDGSEEAYYLPPESAGKVAMWLNMAAADAKRYQRSN